jgi:hypothetical protein
MAEDAPLNTTRSAFIRWGSRSDRNMWIAIGMIWSAFAALCGLAFIGAAWLVGYV